MYISRNKLEEACLKGIISEEQAENLLKFFTENNLNTEERQKFNIETVLYYGGSIIALGAMAYYMHDLVTSSTYGFILLLSIIYSLVFYFAANYMWKKENKTPAGLLYILFMFSVSYIVLVITKMTGVYPKFSEAHNYTDFFAASKPALYTIFSLTLIASIVLIKKRPLSILTLPVIASLYSICYLFIPDIFDKLIVKHHHGELYYGILFSCILIASAFKNDKLYSIDYSKWMYITGSLMLYFCITDLSYMFLNIDGHDYINRIILLIFNVIFILLSILLRRKIFLLLGGIGFFGYMVSLEISLLTSVKADSLIQISFIIISGLLAVFAGNFYNRNIEKIEAAAEKLIPAKFRKNLPKYR